VVRYFSVGQHWHTPAGGKPSACSEQVESESSWKGQQGLPGADGTGKQQQIWALASPAGQQGSRRPDKCPPHPARASNTPRTAQRRRLMSPSPFSGDSSRKEFSERLTVSPKGVNGPVPFEPPVFLLILSAKNRWGNSFLSILLPERFAKIPSPWPVFGVYTNRKPEISLLQGVQIYLFN